MAKRKQTPDIPGDLLGGETKETAGQDATKPVENQPSRQGRLRCVDEYEPAHGIFAASPRLLRSAGLGDDWEADFVDEQAGKVKTSLYLSPNTLDRLEESRRRLRTLADKERREPVSKSRIVELALQIALEDLERQDSENELSRRLLKT